MDDATRKLMASLIAQFADASDALIAGRVSATAWHNQVARELFAHYLAAYSAARGLPPDSRAVLKDVRSAVGAQVKYLDGFTNDIAAGRYANTPDALRARLLMYAGSLKSAAQRGAHSDWPLPYWPAEGTDCHTNCGCYWDIDVQDAEELNGDAYWRRGKDDSCATCRTREQRNPYRIREGVLA